MPQARYLQAHKSHTQDSPSQAHRDHAQSAWRLHDKDRLPQQLPSHNNKTGARPARPRTRNPRHPVHLHGIPQLALDLFRDLRRLAVGRLHVRKEARREDGRPQNLVNGRLRRYRQRRGGRLGHNRPIKKAVPVVTNGAVQQHPKRPHLGCPPGIPLAPRRDLRGLGDQVA